MIHTMTMGLRVKKRHERTAYINMEQILYLWITNAHALNIESCFLNSHWPITTNVVNSNSAQMRCTWYNIMLWSLSVTCDRSVVFSEYSGLLHQQNWLPQYNWNIVENGVKHPNPNPKFTLSTFSNLTKYVKDYRLLPQSGVYFIPVIYITRHSLSVFTWFFPSPNSL
jgi:hypothetical protein